MQHPYCGRNKNPNITLRMLFYLNVLYIIYLLSYIVLIHYNVDSKISQQFKEKRNRQLFTWVQQRNISLGIAVEGTLWLCPSECSDNGGRCWGKWQDGNAWVKYFFSPCILINIIHMFLLSSAYGILSFVLLPALLGSYITLS